MDERLFFAMGCQQDGVDAHEREMAAACLVWTAPVRPLAETSRVPLTRVRPVLAAVARVMGGRALVGADGEEAVLDG